MIAAVDDVDEVEPVYRRDNISGELIADMSYAEWEKAKKIDQSNGADSGAKKTEGWQDRHAKQYYEEVRNRKPFADAYRIAEHTRFTSKEIEEIRQHVFISKHELDGGIKRFDPDYDQSQAWQRLIDRDGIIPSDKIFLEHEHLELTLMREKGYSYNETHEITNKTYNWQELL